MLPHALLLLSLFTVSAVCRNTPRSSNSHEIRGGGNIPPYKDPNVPVDERVVDLLGRMTIEDKMGQLMQGMYIDTYRLFCLCELPFAMFLLPRSSVG